MFEDEESIEIQYLLNQTRDRIRFELNNEDIENERLLEYDNLNAFSLEKEDLELTHLHVL